MGFDTIRRCWVAVNRSELMELLDYVERVDSLLKEADSG